MRAVGVLFTVMALVLVQAPWIMCNCEGEAGCGPLFADCKCLGHHAEEHAKKHGHHHHGHGSHNHHHGHHHHGDPHHDDEGGDDEGPCEHVGFRVPMGTMPAPVGLDAPVLTLDLALIFDAPVMTVCAPQLPERIEPPPGPHIAPSVVTERLLL